MHLEAEQEGAHEFEAYLVYRVETLPLPAKGERWSGELVAQGLRALAALTEDLG